MHLAALLLVAAGTPSDLHGMLGKTMSGATKELSELKGKPVLMVNVASR